MLQDSTKVKHAMESRDAQWRARPNKYPGGVHMGDETTVEESTTREGEEEMVAEEFRVTSSTATTVSSNSKQTGNSSNVHTSCRVVEEWTDPTSSPSEMLDEPDRKCTDSPIDSDRAVYGSNSVLSESSESSTEQNDSKKSMTAAVDLDIQAVGGQFDEPCVGREDVSFHNPENDAEAQFINDKVKKANHTMENIALNPQAHYRDHGSSYRISALSNEPPQSAFDAERDNAHMHNVQFTPNTLPPFDVEEEINIERPRKAPSSCCVIQ